MYCNYKEKDIQTLVNLIGSLWMQLIQNRASISTDAEDLYKSHVDKGTHPTPDEVLKAFQSELSRYSKVFVIVDALGEFPPGDQFQAVLGVRYDLPRYTRVPTRILAWVYSSR
jgi:hypothetical protein